MATTHDIPANLNGAMLLDELASTGITVDRLALSIRDGQLHIEGDHDQAAADTVVQAHQGGDSPSVANERTIREQVASHLTDLRAITGSSGTLTAAQLSNAVRVLARGQIRLIRMALDLYDGTD